MLNYGAVSWLGISSKTIDEVAARELQELQCRDRPLPSALNKTDEEEPGTLEEVARLASQWFQRYLTSDNSSDAKKWTFYVG